MTAVKLISITPGAEALIAYCGRVSSAHQDNPEYEKLLRYLVAHAHWSPFQMAHAVLEIRTNRAISAQILRHASFAFQEFSQRYAAVAERPEITEGRKQSEKNRQSSSEPLSEDAQSAWEWQQRQVYDYCYEAYEKALDTGVAREQARLLLPLATPTTMYMAGSIRSWIHYLQIRCHEDTQLDHRLIADEARAILARELPTIAAALGWTQDGPVRSE